MYSLFGSSILISVTIKKHKYITHKTSLSAKHVAKKLKKKIFSRLGRFANGTRIKSAFYNGLSNIHLLNNRFFYIKKTLSFFSEIELLSNVFLSRYSMDLLFHEYMHRTSCLFLIRRFPYIIIKKYNRRRKRKRLTNVNIRLINKSFKHTYKKFNLYEQGIMHLYKLGLSSRRAFGLRYNVSKFSNVSYYDNAYSKLTKSMNWRLRFASRGLLYPLVCDGRDRYSLLKQIYFRMLCKRYTALSKCKDTINKVLLFSTVRNNMIKQIYKMFKLNTAFKNRMHVIRKRNTSHKSSIHIRKLNIHNRHDNKHYNINNINNKNETHQKHSQSHKYNIDNKTNTYHKHSKYHRYGINNKKKTPHQYSKYNRYDINNKKNTKLTDNEDIIKYRYISQSKYEILSRRLNSYCHNIRHRYKRSVYINKL
jgi:hypothetical protein